MKDYKDMTDEELKWITNGDEEEVTQESVENQGVFRSLLTRIRARREAKTTRASTETVYANTERTTALYVQDVMESLLKAAEADRARQEELKKAQHRTAMEVEATRQVGQRTERVRLRDLEMDLRFKKLRRREEYEMMEFRAYEREITRGLMQRAAGLGLTLSAYIEITKAAMLKGDDSEMKEMVTQMKGGIVWNEFQTHLSIVRWSRFRGHSTLLTVVPFISF